MSSEYSTAVELLLDLAETHALSYTQGKALESIASEMAEAGLTHEAAARFLDDILGVILESERDESDDEL